MSSAKIRFQKVSLKDLQKILPQLVVDGNENHRRHQNAKKKNKQQVATTTKLKSRA